MGSGGVDVPFSPLVRRWFTERFGTPTPAQEAGWPAIAAGARHADRGADRLGQDARGVPLVARSAAAPRRGRHARGPHPRRLRLAAEGARQRHPEEPARSRSAELRALAEARGTSLPELRVTVRTGDTPASERAGDDAPAAAHPHHHARVALHPAHRREAADASWPAPRRSSSTRSTPSRRTSAARTWRSRSSGSTRSPAGRCSASACRRRRSRSRRSRGCSPAPTRPAADHRRRRPPPRARSVGRDARRTLGPIATHELWAAIYDRIVALIAEHRTTIVFVNTRRLVERVAHELEERLGAGPRGGAPRQHGAPHPARGRGEAQGGRGAGRGRDRVARARHRRRRRRSGVPPRRAALRSRRCSSASAAPATRAARCRRASSSRSTRDELVQAPRRSAPCGRASSTAGGAARPARHPGAAVRRHRPRRARSAWTSCSRWCAAPIRIATSTRRGARARARDARRGRGDAPRPARRRTSTGIACTTALRARRGARLAAITERRRHSRHRRLRGDRGAARARWSAR